MGLALVLAAAAAGCTAGSALEGLPPGDGAEMASAAADRRGPVVEVLPPAVAQSPPLDPAADPRTPLGALRARYFPVWTQDFDGAFPPEVCGTAWELDAIAAPVTNVDVSPYGDPRLMAALAVMRYEHLTSRALARPAPLEQLCVAVASMDPARADALGRLVPHVESGEPGTAPVAFPGEVTLLAAGPSAALAVACTAADAPTEPAQARLAAYLLHLAQGSEDRVVDISYRVTRVDSRSAGSCAELPEWTALWEQQASDWIAEGQAWTRGWLVISVDDICSAPPASGTQDCPADWSR